MFRRLVTYVTGNFVPLARTINSKPLSADVVLTPEDIGLHDVFEYKGVIDCSLNPNYPAANAGHVYKVSVAGKIGGASGVTVEINDSLRCDVDDSPGGTQAEVGDDWSIMQANIDVGSYQGEWTLN